MQGFDDNELLVKFRYPLLTLLLGLVLTGFGVFIFKTGVFLPETKIEVLDSTTEGQAIKEITAEISGAVIRPGVYKLSLGARTEDLLVTAGGLSGDADRIWIDKFLNRAAKLSDGQKVYIPNTSNQSEVLSAKTKVGDQTISGGFSSDSNSLININSASLVEMDSLPGIGQVYGQSIIEHRPYSNVEELVSRGILRTSVFNKIKDLISIY